MLFLGQVVVTAGVCLVLWFLCGSVGMAVLPARRDESADEDAPSTWNQFGIGACVGLAVLIALGGLGLTLRLPIWLTVGLFAVVGIVLSVQRLRRVGVSSFALTMGGLGLVALGVLAVVALAESAAGIRIPPNTCDDLRAYIPMARRLIDTNGLDEPWSIRRLLNFGGMSFLQAVPYAGLGGRAIGVIECLVTSVFLGGVFVANGFRRSWARVAAILFIAAIPFFWVPRVNSAALFIVVPFLLATFAAGTEIRAALVAGRLRDALRWGVAAGLTCAAIASLRITVLPVAAVAIVLGVLILSGAPFAARARALGAVVVSGVVAFAPWCIAMWQSSGTPLFPLIRGNANPTGPSNRDPGLETFGDFASHAWDMVQTNNYLWVTLAAVVVALIAWRLLPDPRNVVIVSVVAAISMPGTAVFISLAPEWDYARYVSAAAHSVVIFLLYEVLRGADFLTATAPAAEPDAQPEPMTAARRRTRWLVLVAVPVTVVIVIVAFRPITPARFLKSGSTLVSYAFTDEARRVQDKEVTAYPSERNYERALGDIPKSRKVIIAVDHPGLIDFSKWDVPTMDLPGWADVGPDFPFFQGPEAKFAALRRAGYDTLLVTKPGADACFAVTRLYSPEDFDTPEITMFWRYFEDWADDIDTLWLGKLAPGVKEYGMVLAIDLHTPRPTESSTG